MPFDPTENYISRTVGSTTTNLVRVGDENGGQVLQDVQGTTVVASYTFGNGLIGKGSDVNLLDGQGTSRQTTSSSGTVTSSRVFEGFGNLVASARSGENYGYAATSGYLDDGDADSFDPLRSPAGPSAKFQETQPLLYRLQNSHKEIRVSLSKNIL